HVPFKSAAGAPGSGALSCDPHRGDVMTSMKATAPPGPLVTFFVMGYNQEETIAKGIEGAFAQTYEPLEIILADDGSRDGTYRVMQEMAAAYTGPHRIRLSRNEPNRGITGNINRIMELAEGVFVVQNNG